MTKELIFARFKANQGLSNRDAAKIFQVSLDLIKDWNKSPGIIPDAANNVALALNIMMERWKKENGMTNDVDYQHLMKNAENLQKENDELKETIRQLEEKDINEILTDVTSRTFGGKLSKAQQTALLSQDATLQAIEAVNNPTKRQIAKALPLGVV